MFVENCVQKVKHGCRADTMVRIECCTGILFEPFSAFNRSTSRSAEASSRNTSMVVNWCSAFSGSNRRYPSVSNRTTTKARSVSTLLTPPLREVAYKPTIKLAISLAPVRMQRPFSQWVPYRGNAMEPSGSYIAVLAYGHLEHSTGSPRGWLSLRLVTPL